MPNPHVGDAGTVFVVTCRDQDHQVIDISGATSMSIQFEKPDGTTLTKAAAFFTDGTDGKLQCTTTADDLDQEGEWDMQAYINKPGWAGYTDIMSFRVDPTILTV